ncbi:hypothetical protein PR048_019442, partial [Dryococelus australis]
MEEPLILKKTDNTHAVLKQPGSWHFKCAPSKRIKLTQGVKTCVVKVRGETAYSIDTKKSMFITNKNYSISEIKPMEICTNNVWNNIKETLRNFCDPISVETGKHFPNFDTMWMCCTELKLKMMVTRICR